MKNHDWSELVESRDAQLDDLDVSLARGGVPRAEACRLEVLGHLEGLVHLVLDLLLVALLK